MKYQDMVRARNVINATGYGGISGKLRSEIIITATRCENSGKGRRDEGLRRIRLDRSETGKKVSGTGRMRRGSTCLSGAGVETNNPYVMLRLARTNTGTRRFATPEWSAGSTCA